MNPASVVGFAVWTRPGTQRVEDGPVLGMHSWPKIGCLSPPKLAFHFHAETCRAIGYARYLRVLEKHPGQLDHEIQWKLLVHKVRQKELWGTSPRD